MEIVYFTVVAIALYFIADWLVDRVEHFLGRRLEQRSLLFFVLLLALALASFAAIRHFTAA